MISKTSCKKWVVFSGAIKRFKWLSIFYGVTLFLELPLLIWLQLSKQKALQGDLWAEVANKNLLPHVLFNPFEHFVNIIVAVVFGLILFNYLQKDRASTFFHSLPIKRVSLYCQHLLAGFTLIWLPILVNGLLIYGVFAFFGVTEGQWQNHYTYSQGIGMAQNSIITVTLWKVVGYWLVLSFLMTGFFYIFTVFIGMLTGNVLLQGALTFIGLFLPLGLYLLIKYSLWKLLYGFSRDIEGNTMEWLSPLVSYLTEQNSRLFGGETWYSWYFVIALILGGLSIYLYKKRHVEAAGETLAAEWMRRVFKYGVAVCAALTGGLYLGSIYENSTGVLYLGYFIGAVLGYIIADMIAYKSFHFYKHWKGMVAFGAVFIVLLTTINLDLYGYESYIPEQQEVKEVFLNSLNRDGRPTPQGLTGKENIRRVRELHRQIIKLEDENKANDKAMNNGQKTVANPMAPVSMVIPMDITYVLDNGRKVKRSYRIDIYRYREFLYPIITTQEAKKSLFGQFFRMEEDKIDQININNHRFGKSVRIYKRAEISEALAALRKDVLAISYEASMEGKVPSQANVEFVSKDGQKNNYISTNLEYYTEFKNFEGFLIKHGYLKELVFDTGDVSALIINQLGSEKKVEVRDKEEIKVLLSWARLEDANSYAMRQQQPRNSQYIEYYGKLVKEKGGSIYIGFDSSPYPLQLISKIINEK